MRYFNHRSPPIRIIAAIHVAHLAPAVELEVVVRRELLRVVLHAEEVALLLNDVPEAPQDSPAELLGVLLRRFGFRPLDVFVRLDALADAFHNVCKPARNDEAHGLEHGPATLGHLTEGKHVPTPQIDALLVKQFDNLGMLDECRDNRLLTNSVVVAGELLLETPYQKIDKNISGTL